MNLSKNFTLEELTATDSHLMNVPTEKEITKLSKLVTKVLQPLRDSYGKPICINSGYRTIAVNKEQGGMMNPLSQHCKGEAADIETVDNALLFHLIRTNFVFDQLIWEGGDDRQPDWVHVSYKSTRNRHQALRMEVIQGVKKYRLV